MAGKEAAQAAQAAQAAEVAGAAEVAEAVGYWQKRAVANVLATEKTCEDVAKLMGAHFELAERELVRQVNDFYAKYSEAEGVTLAEARRQLDPQELTAFKQDVKHYAEQRKLLAKALTSESAKANADNLRRGLKSLEADAMRHRISRLEAFRVRARETLEELCTRQLGEMHRGAVKAFVNGRNLTSYDLAKGTGWAVKLPASKVDELEKILAKPWGRDALGFSERIWTDRDKLTTRIDTHFTQGLIRQVDRKELIKELQNEFRVSQSSARRLVYTEGLHFLNEGKKEAYKARGLEEYQIIETLDPKTCPICGDMDMKTLKLSEYVAGVTAPPFHPYCRGTFMPSAKDYEDEAEDTRTARGTDLKRYRVPANMTYNDWKANYLEKEQNNADQRDTERGT